MTLPQDFQPNPYACAVMNVSALRPVFVQTYANIHKGPALRDGDKTFFRGHNQGDAIFTIADVAEASTANIIFAELIREASE